MRKQGSSNIANLTNAAIIKHHEKNPTLLVVAPSVLSCLARQHQSALQAKAAEADDLFQDQSDQSLEKDSQPGHLGLVKEGEEEGDDLFQDQSDQSLEKDSQPGHLGLVEEGEEGDEGEEEGEEEVEEGEEGDISEELEEFQGRRKNKKMTEDQLVQLITKTQEELLAMSSDEESQFEDDGCYYSGLKNGGAGRDAKD